VNKRKQSDKKRGSYHKKVLKAKGKMMRAGKQMFNIEDVNISFKG